MIIFFSLEGTYKHSVENVLSRLTREEALANFALIITLGINEERGPSLNVLSRLTREDALANFALIITLGINEERGPSLNVLSRLTREEALANFARKESPN